MARGKVIAAHDLLWLVVDARGRVSQTHLAPTTTDTVSGAGAGAGAGAGVGSAVGDAFRSGLTVPMVQVEAPASVIAADTGAASAVPGGE